MRFPFFYDCARNLWTAATLRRFGFLSCFCISAAGIFSEPEAVRSNPVTRGQAVAVCVQRNCDVL